MSTSPKAARLIPLIPGQQSEEMTHISSFALIRNGKGEILLVKKIRPEFTAGKYIFPSSIINYGEDPRAAIHRIVREQVGTEAKDVKLLDVQSYGDKHWDLCFVYSASVDGIGKLHPDLERADYFAREKFPPEFRSDHMEVLQSYEKNTAHP